MVQDSLTTLEAPVLVPLLRTGRPEAHALTEAVATAFAHGERVDWTACLGAPGTSHVDLPTYAFQRQWYWLARPAATTAADGRRRSGRGRLLGGRRTRGPPGTLGRPGHRRQRRRTPSAASCPPSPPGTGSAGRRPPRTVSATASTWSPAHRLRRPRRHRPLARRPARRRHRRPVDRTASWTRCTTWACTPTYCDTAAPTTTPTRPSPGPTPPLDGVLSGSWPCDERPATADAALRAPRPGRHHHTAATPWRRRASTRRCGARPAAPSPSTGTTRPTSPVQAQIWGLGRVAALERRRAGAASSTSPRHLDRRAVSALLAALAVRTRTRSRSARPGPSPAAWTRSPQAATPAPGGAPTAPSSSPAAPAPSAATSPTGSPTPGAEHLVLTSRRGPHAPGAERTRRRAHRPGRRGHPRRLRHRRPRRAGGRPRRTSRRSRR
ncbi:SDR family NAD(P)-dependent oxidoreductase OS=Streptomyces rimosus subsp. rimosus (strain ATCC / DSM 40260 / JCM 4667 / NRRL 2234) OX=1265868 GN=SRIM_038790 PE=4 SV=1 [Streptomyces rimosus subsp. rimosus]